VQKVQILKKVLHRAQKSGPETTFVDGGERGIRTPDTRKGIHAFEARAFSHSAISPLRVIDYVHQDSKSLDGSARLLIHAQGRAVTRHRISRTFGSTFFRV
jgi:hypothetical protein